MQVSGSDSIVAEDSSLPGCVRCVACRTVIDVSKTPRNFRKFLNIHQSTQSNILKKMKSKPNCDEMRPSYNYEFPKKLAGF